MIVNLVKSRANPAALRRIGNLWDVLTFWPRSFHPFAVRPYAERAVPELREFLLHGPRNSPLVVTAHSQGSVLRSRPWSPCSARCGDRSGSSRSGRRCAACYRRFFPRCFAAERIARAPHALGDRWRNVFRFTDHVGRAVFVDDGEACRRYADHAGASGASTWPTDRSPTRRRRIRRSRGTTATGRARGPRRRRAGGLGGRGRAAGTADVELRLALAMRGGVSLGGVDRRRVLRDRRAPRRHGPPNFWTTGCAAGYERVVVDVLAGASAGGLNGVLYAASQVYGFPSRMREIWLQLGSTENLVRARRAVPVAVPRRRVLPARVTTNLRRLIERREPPAHPPALDLSLSVTYVEPSSGRCPARATSG